MLRGLSSYYYKEPTLLLLVRLAQGLVHLGKGLLTLAPARADSTLVSGELFVILTPCFNEAVYACKALLKSASKCALAALLSC